MPDANAIVAAINAHCKTLVIMIRRAGWPFGLMTQFWKILWE